MLSALLMLPLAAQAGNYNKKNDTMAKETTMVKGKDIVETAVQSGSFDTLVKAIRAADLVETLKQDGPFTVFAPTDAAFAKLPKEDLEALLKDKDKLKKVLTYHVVSGKVMAKDVLALKKAKTLEGESLKIKAKNAKEAVMIDGAKVTKTDIETSNGVIHVIDTVLMPKG